MLIKVCGITSLRDAMLAVRFGASALGFICHPPSPRYVDYDTIEFITGRLPEGVLKVGVYVKGGLDDVREELFDAIQLHGFDSEDEVLALNKRIIVAVPADGTGRFPDQEIIVDESMGGGREADWSALEDVERDYILSGGLRPSNLGRALERLDPAGIDVCSGVEAAPGVKDSALLRQFLETAAAYNEAGEKNVR